MTGVIFDIKELSLYDGPGTRVTVFMKGCPLRCIWCHNPEGIEKKPELMIKSSRCVQCGKCKYPCDHVECRPFERCIHACPNGCINVAGISIEAQQLAGQLCNYRDFLEMNGGGITFSGGEPLLQPDFLCDVIDGLDGMHTAIQTCGYADSNVFRKVIDKVDYVMFDIKIADPALHRKYIGTDNDIILKNFQYLRQCGRRYIVRTPMIPGITDTQKNIMEIYDMIGDSNWERLEYNTMAGAKYPMLGKTYFLEEQKHSDRRNDLQIRKIETKTL